MLKSLAQMSIAALMLSTGVASTVLANDEVQFPEPVQEVKPQPGLGTRLIQKFTYTTEDGTTIRPTVMTPNNVEDHSTTTYQFGVEATF